MKQRKKKGNATNWFSKQFFTTCHESHNLFCTLGLVHLTAFFTICCVGLQLGLVIDLTNTSRYYPVSDLKKEGIKHVKVCCGQPTPQPYVFQVYIIPLNKWLLFLVLTFEHHGCGLDPMQGPRFST